MKKNIFTKSIFILALLLTITFSVTAASYSWIARRFNPTISGSNLSIESTGALMVTFTNQISATSSADLNSIISVEDFVFKQMSSTNGSTFYYVDFSDENYDNPVVKELSSSATSEEAQTLGLLRFRFALSLQSDFTGTRAVFFNPDTMITADDSSSYNYQDAIRISFAYTVGSNDPVTKIFANNSGTYTVISSTAVGKEVEIDENPLSATYGDLIAIDSTGIYDGTQVVYSFQNFNGQLNPTADDDWVINNPSNLDTNKILLSMDSTTSMVWIDCNIWLEGCDEASVIEINSLNLDVLLKFDSIIV